MPAMLEWIFNSASLCSGSPQIMRSRRRIDADAEDGISPINKVICLMEIEATKHSGLSETMMPFVPPSPLLFLPCSLFRSQATSRKTRKGQSGQENQRSRREDSSFSEENGKRA